VTSVPPLIQARALITSAAWARFCRLRDEEIDNLQTHKLHAR